MEFLKLFTLTIIRKNGIRSSIVNLLGIITLVYCLIYYYTKVGKSPYKTKLEHGMMRKRIPDALIIGVKKGGTFAMAKFLQYHPEVKIAVKERHFFENDINYAKGLQSYIENMPLSGPEHLVIERTATYFNKFTVAKRVHDANPNMKLILLVRNPIDRLVSDFLETQLYSHHHWSDFNNLVTKTYSDGRFEVHDNLWVGVDIGKYDIHYQNWAQYFPPSQMLVVSSEKFVEKPWEELERVQNFLGISIQITKSNFSSNTGNFWNIFCGPTGKSTCLFENKGRKHPELNETVRIALKDYYRPRVAAFETMVGMKFGWLEG
ncbi:heparan sulfate glucosamine 3-O-sulfotransferase 1-like [Neocloeon triangulifer]|uniref:heparan sulfate glucosamine 3-O-sulfotransferase 1-like n=1 Tax=Neocloeon triangulifer TaxID=2078957 RepID=UPI00286F07E8|nr:heparan sulfate glucosamine 3-O-sulfotransferase 1-like [Neocloeon triangulifer]